MSDLRHPRALVGTTGEAAGVLRGDPLRVLPWPDDSCLRSRERQVACHAAEAQRYDYLRHQPGEGRSGTGGCIVLHPDPRAYWTTAEFEQRRELVRLAPRLVFPRSCRVTTRNAGWLAQAGTCDQLDRVDTTGG